MPESMYIIFTLRKDVPDKETAVQIFDLVKQKLSDRPDISLHAQITTKFSVEEST